MLPVVREKKDFLFAYIFLLLVSSSAFAIIYIDFIVAIPPLLLSVLALAKIISKQKRRDSARDRIKILIFNVLFITYFVSLSLIFPTIVVIDGNVTNFMGHFSGLVVGLIIQGVVFQHSLRN
ncbi:hypothetical protein AFULGI_00006420 [Archaeoglobus fulgidus DSM 8774]|uniref:Uncharacterized protein n=2 Tax=Archaeoglobus fulgidus TaxID=2234 RepID=A0A075WIM6_ARCFL|nr:hypothetical protein AFULGI_00006420 [Archaeoglobus fulgidus DSM 8774]